MEDQENKLIPIINSEEESLEIPIEQGPFPFLDKSLIEFNEAQIFDLKDFIDKYIFEEPRTYSNFPEKFENIIKERTSCGDSIVNEIYEEISSERTLKGNLSFRNLVRCVVVWKTLQGNHIEPEKYPVFIEVARLLNKDEMFRINHFAVLVILKLLTFCRDKSTEFDKIVKAYQFALQLSTTIKSRYNLKIELSFLSSCIKSRISSTLSSPSQASVLEAISLLKQAEQYSMSIPVFKNLIRLSINRLRRRNLISQDLNSEVLKQTEAEIPFPVPLEDKEENLPEPVSSIYNQELLDATKVEPVYMTQQSSVQVSIWKAKLKDSDQLIAIKECSSSNVESLQGYIEEAEVLKKLSGESKNFLQFYSCKLLNSSEGENKKFVFIIQMEFVASNLKQDKIQRDGKNKPYNDLEILSIYKQLILAYNLMREKNILHCDIKPSNILITDDFVLKIIDFNAAKVGIDEQTTQAQAVGTKDFMSPELREAFETGKLASLKEDKSDVFSLGITILSLVCNEPLIDLNLKKNEMKLLGIVDSIKFEWLKPILKGMLRFDYVMRTGLKQLIVHFPEDRTVTCQT